jgi:hypothetical protein
MPTATYNKFTPAVESILEGMNLGTDSFAIKLATAVNQSAGTFTETTNGGGYTTGGNTVGTNSTATQSGGTYKVTLSDPAVWTGSGGGFSFQYAVLVNTTAGVNVGYWDYSSLQTVAAGETVTVDLDASNGVFQVT